MRAPPLPVRGVALVAALALVGGGGTATAAPEESEPTLTSIHASFDDDLKTTFYDVVLRNTDASVTIWRWDFTPDPNDETCNQFSVLEETNTFSKVAFAHGDDAGCHHAGRDHNVDIEVVVDTERYTCNARIHGTDTPSGPEPEPCSEKPARPVNTKAPPAAPPKMSKTDKDLLEGAAYFNLFSAGVSGIGAVALTLVPSPDPFTKGAAVALAGMAATSGSLGIAALAKAGDPPDRRYKTLAKLAFPRPGALGTPGGATAAEAAAVNDVLRNTAAIVGYDHAFLTSFERAQGAHAAKSGKWDRIQAHTAARFARAEADLLTGRPALEQAVRRSVEAAGPRRELTVEDARKALAEIGAHGLPVPVVALAKSLGVRRAELDVVRGRILRVAPQKAAGPVSASIAPPGLAAAHLKVARVLRRLAARLDKR
jgi:hypothetical protein